jgi:hypothetical protein
MRVSVGSSSSVSLTVARCTGFKPILVNANPERRGETTPIGRASEVLQKFQHWMSTTDFKKEAANWPNLRATIEQALDSGSLLVFVAYFVTEADIAQTTVNPVNL